VLELKAHFKARQNAAEDTALGHEPIIFILRLSELEPAIRLES
jgi:hypothetical protein